jgi:hypothetical protein
MMFDDVSFPAPPEGGSLADWQRYGTVCFTTHRFLIEQAFLVEQHLLTSVDALLSPAQAWTKAAEYYDQIKPRTDATTHPPPHAGSRRRRPAAAAPQSAHRLRAAARHVDPRPPAHLPPPHPRMEMTTTHTLKAQAADPKGLTLGELRSFLADADLACVPDTVRIKGTVTFRSGLKTIQVSA